MRKKLTLAWAFVPIHRIAVPQDWRRLLRLVELRGTRLVAELMPRCSCWGHLRDPMAGFFTDATADEASGRTRASAKKGRGSNRRAASLRRHMMRCLTATQTASLSYLNPNSYVSISSTLTWPNSRRCVGCCLDSSLPQKRWLGWVGGRRKGWAEVGNLSVGT